MRTKCLPKPRREREKTPRDKARRTKTKENGIETQRKPLRDRDGGAETEGQPQRARERLRIAVKGLMRSPRGQHCQGAKSHPFHRIWGSREPQGGRVPGSGVQCQQILGIVWPGAQRAPPAHWGEMSKGHRPQPEVGRVAHVEGPGCQAERNPLRLGVGPRWMPPAATCGWRQAPELAWAWGERPHPGPSSGSSLREQGAHSAASRWPSPQSGI